MNDLVRIPQGASFARTYESIRDENDALVTDFTGWSFGGSIKAALADTDVAALVTIADGAFSRVAGKVGFVLTPAQMSALAVGPVYFFAVKARSPSGFVDTIDELRLQLSQTARKSI